MSMEGEDAAADAGIEGSETRYVYGFRIGSAVSTVDGETYYLAKIGIVTEPGIARVLHRFYQHSNSIAEAMGAHLRVPSCTTSSGGVIDKMSPTHHRVGKREQLSIGSANDLARAMKDPKGAIEDDHEDLCFALPIADHITAKHEIEQIEAILRYQLGATVLETLNLAQQFTDVQTSLGLIAPLSYKVNYSELVAMPTKVFDGVQAMFTAEAIDNVVTLCEALHRDGKAQPLAFQHAQEIEFPWMFNFTNKNVHNDTILVTVRAPLARECTIGHVD